MIDDRFYLYGALCYNDDINTLSLNNSYNDVVLENLDIQYDYSDDRLLELKSKYKLDQIAGSGNDFSRALRITLHIANLLNFGYPCDTSSFHAIEVLERTSLGFKSNCFIAATVLTECLLSLGYEARMIRCMPIDLRFNECHCMTLSKIRTLNKHIAFDPAMGGIYIDNLGRPMGIGEIKNALIDNVEFKLRSIFPIQQQIIKMYLAKNLVRFQSYQISKYGNEIGNQSKHYINLNPTSIPLLNKKTYVNDIEICHTYIYNSKQFWGN